MYHYKVKRILKVVDGDTVDVEIDLGFGISFAHRIRLKNIDAPETRTLNFEEKAKGLASKEWLSKELSGSESWTIKTTKEDKYGRYLGLFYSGDETTSLNERMVQLGMAVPFMVDKND